MIIKKWNGSNAWTAISPKVTYTDIVADVTAATPVSIFSGGKLGISYLPDAVFDSLLYASVVSSNLNAQGFGAALEGAWLAATAINRNTKGSYFVISTGGSSISEQTTGIQITLSQEDPKPYWKWTFKVADSSGGTNPTTSGTLEAGDWIVVEEFTGSGSSGDPYFAKLAVVSNTYETMTGATSSTAGAVGLVPAPASGSQTKYLRGDATWNTIAYSEISDTPSLATVATSGSYNDLINKPSIPSAPTDLSGNAYKIYYSDVNGNLQELALGANNTVLKGEGTTSAPTFGQVAYSEISGTPTALTSFLGNGNWKLFYSNGSGDVVELPLGANNTVLKGEGTTSAPTFGQIDYSEIANTPSIPSAPNNATITIAAGTGLQTGGDFTTDQASNETITLNMRYPVVYASTLPTTGDAVSGLASGAIGFEG